MEDDSNDSGNQPSSIKGWTKDEKFYLWQALKEFASSDIVSIHEYIRTKTPHEIQLAINHYKKRILDYPQYEKAKIRPKKLYKPKVPLTSWAQLLTDNIPLEELKTESSKAVRMIAELEVIPNESCVEHIDFRKVYHTIANAMEGKPLQLDKLTIAVLNKCVIETALSSKSFLKLATVKALIDSINFDRQVTTFLKPTENEELTILRHLASQKNYNPLRMQEMYLTPTCESENYDELVTDPDSI